MTFMETVMHKGHLENAFVAKDITELVFRTMRDLMTTEASDRVAIELKEENEEVPTEEYKPIPDDLGDLWRDTDPVMGFLSRIQGPMKFDSDSFLFRLRQEANLPEGIDLETVICAVFSATKQELSQARIEEIASFLPEKIRRMWNQAS
ncbi:DUF2267 domain-containing protein [Allocoleopsis franciscana]|uniref:DUF2267 domain-containing protein n=1 Tax=Allocoleopsis franciscana PCC 7113 TaxID=1173027 RepID=K9WFT8_9CYAN|nr:DUF2267 domain-containing protein [Allocoleopsis franciscana]AFZ19285.1 hypothetical protein Mic7113_3561 [Allocoleopsis franciscana PCC 7113]